MRYLLVLIITMMIPEISFSQLFISTELDARNAIEGSKYNNYKSTYDGVFNLGYHNEGFQVQASYENFKVIDFYSFGFKAGYSFNHEGDFNYVILGGLGLIQRNVDWIGNTISMSASISGQLEYHFNKVFLLARSELRHRGDLERVIFSGYVGIGYKFTPR